MSEVDLRGKRVFIRADLNVPCEGGRITDDTRIRASVPGIQAALGQGAAVMVASHLGRPKAKPEAKYSLAPVAARHVIGHFLPHVVAGALKGMTRLRGKLTLLLGPVKRQR